MFTRAPSAGPAATRPAASTLAFALAIVLASAPPSAAQLVERPCRIVFDDEMKGDVDPTSTHGEIVLGPKMMQPGGGFMMTGQGRATVTYGAEGQVLRGGCTVIKNRVFEYPIQAFITSDDGANGEVDILPGVFSYEVTLKCPRQGRVPAGEAEQDVAVTIPPTVRLPMLRGASQAYSDGDRRARLEGTMTVEFCRTEPQ